MKLEQLLERCFYKFDRLQTPHPKVPIANQQDLGVTLDFLNQWSMVWITWLIHTNILDTLASGLPYGNGMFTTKLSFTCSPNEPSTVWSLSKYIGANYSKLQQSEKSWTSLVPTVSPCVGCYKSPKDTQGNRSVPGDTKEMFKCHSYITSLFLGVEQFYVP